MRSTGEERSRSGTGEKEEMSDLRLRGGATQSRGPHGDALQICVIDGASRVGIRKKTKIRCNISCQRFFFFWREQSLYQYSTLYAN